LEPEASGSLLPVHVDLAAVRLLFLRQVIHQFLR
jgi:hypothetical protein